MITCNLAGYRSVLVFVKVQTNTVTLVKFVTKCIVDHSSVIFQIGVFYKKDNREL